MLPSPSCVPCTFSTSVAHIECAGLRREASAQLPSAWQPNAAIAALSAMHAQHVRDLHRAHQPQTRSQRPAALNAAARCCNRRAECHARSTRARPTSSAAASHTKPAPCCPQRGSPMLLSSGATHAQHKCDSHGVHHPNKRSGRHAALSTASPCCCRRVPCTLRTSVTHIKGGSPTRAAGAQLLAALQPNAAVAALSAMPAQHERMHEISRPPPVRARMQL